MKFTKQLFAVMVVISMFCSMNVFALTFPDVTTDNTNEEAINVLSSLGIIKGYEDGQFKPDKEVTRAELTSLLMRLLNLSITGTTVADSGYIDVPNNHWAVYDIKTASSMGIIKGFGDGNFGPEQSVTFEQAVKMVVAMLGYEQQSISYGGWPNGYLRSARELNLLKKSEMTQTDPAPRKIIAQILYNALEVDLMVKKNTVNTEEASYEITNGENVMTEYMKIEKVTGTLVANSITRFDSKASNLLEDEVEINVNGSNNKYKVGTNTGAKDLLGLSVIAYAKYDENRINKNILHIMTKSAVEELTVDTEKITNFTKSTLTYEKDGSDKTYNVTIAASPIVIYNGKYIDANYAFSNNLTTPQIGTVTLVNSGNGYNLIKVESYKNYVVKTVDTTANDIYFDTDLVKDTTDTKINVPVDNTFDYNISITKGGSAFAFSSIKKGHIISVKQNDPTQVGIKKIEILVSETKKSGKVTEEADDYVIIDSKKYSISRSLEGTTLESKIVYNASGTFYLDAFDDIAYVEFNVGDTYKYGYIIKSALSTSGGESTGAVKLYDYSTKSIKTFTFNSKIKIDATQFSNHESAVEALENSAKLMNKDSKKENATYSQAVKYLVNSSGYISEINTINPSDGDDTFAPIGDYTTENYYTYNSTNKYFKDKSGKTVATIDSKTIIFSVPNDREEESKYGIKAYSYFTNDVYYRFEVVENTTSGIASVMVLYESNIDEDVYYKSPIFVVNEIKQVTVSGETKTKLTGYNFTTGASAEYIAESASYVSKIAKGDVIRFGVNTDGEINENVYLYLDISEASTNHAPHDLVSSTTALANSIGKDTLNYPMRKVVMVNYITDGYRANNDITKLNDQYAFIYGTPISTIADGTTRSIKLTDLMPTEAGFDTSDTTTLNVSNNVTFFVYDTNESNETKRLSIITSSDTQDRDAVILNLKTSSIAGTDCDSIFVYMDDENLKVVYIIK